jgi:pyruvate formate lyase activating enzyme
MGKPLAGKTYDIQGFSVQDGPGIRTTVFLKGCPLRCPWCHSPESQQFYDQLSWMALRCLGVEACGRCLSVCPQKAISPGKTTVQASTNTEIQLVHVDRKLCNNCMVCASACHTKALDVCGKDWTVDELLERVIRDKPFFEHSGGGVTISGGEALSQFEFTLALLQELKKAGLHTALDTTGYAATEKVRAVLPYTDLFLYDLKHMDSEAHRKMIGVPNEQIISNARLIAESGGKLQIRMPIIPLFNDTESNARATAEFCRELGAAVTLVQLLPYHNMGATKYQRLDDEAKIIEAVPPSEQKIGEIKRIFEQHGLLVTVH